MTDDDDEPSNGGASDRRVAQLVALKASRGWNDSDLARAIGRKPQQIYAWFTGQRKIGEKLARSIERTLELPPEWLDISASVTTANEPPRAWGTSVHSFSMVTTLPREMPLIKWAQIAAMLNTESADLQGTGQGLETFSPCSTKAKFLEMPDDSMAPLIAKADHLLMDPSVAPIAGDIVLVSIPSGEHFVRSFRPRTAYVFEGVPANPYYQPVSSLDDLAAVVAVMIEHRRYRRATS